MSLFTFLTFTTWWWWWFFFWETNDGLRSLTTQKKEHEIFSSTASCAVFYIPLRQTSKFIILNLLVKRKKKFIFNVYLLLFAQCIKLRSCSGNFSSLFYSNFRGRWKISGKKICFHRFAYFLIHLSCSLEKILFHIISIIFPSFWVCSSICQCSKVYFLMRNYHTQTIHLQFPSMNAMRIIFSHILPESRHSTTSKVSRAVKTKFNFTWMTLSSSFLHHWHQLTTLMLWNCWKNHLNEWEWDHLSLCC